MSEVLLHRFTRAEYYRMAETGVLAPDARVELVDGQVIDMLSLGPFHCGTVTRLNRAFESANRDRYLTSPQNALPLGEYYEPQPDLMLLKPSADFYTEQHPKPSDVFLLVEVADSTLPLDPKKKLPAYAAAGVVEVWLVNAPDRWVEVYRQPVSGRYSSSLTVRPGEKLAPEAFPDVAIDTQALLGRAQVVEEGAQPFQSGLG